MLVLHEGDYGSYADTHSPDENESIELVPLYSNIGTSNDFGTEFTLKGIGNSLARLTYLYDSYLHIRFFILWHSSSFACKITIFIFDYQRIFSRSCY